MSKSLVRFNINEYVRVRFTPASLALWRQHSEELRLSRRPTMMGFTGDNFGQSCT